MTLQYYLIYKPYQVLTQFSPEGNKQTLADYFDVPRDVYPVGRLDYDSEGLLLLTNDKTLNHRLLNPLFAHEREYWVQVDGAVTPAAVNQLEKGVDINVDGKLYRTRPCKASIFDTEPEVPVRNPPIRFRKNIPAPWIQMVLQEGKNRQVRKMTAAVGFPTLRLIRYRMEGLHIAGMQPGDMRLLQHEAVMRELFGTAARR
ncbi:pseudouridine synthase [Chitinophaga pendula]|uniref:pseudouridine synthase n=1 Tax=Chitinophaga TaxID=79328 RepID=UPI000BB06537|nr:MULTISPECIES: pseudouridine synthase [Chitinophaga]ASZ10298.1 pseudouridine synthase [Chitinophaga sp. MD30]UCJ06740.1 pseudouridine synthase [Chitinophaga pendula]